MPTWRTKTLTSIGFLTGLESGLGKENRCQLWINSAYQIWSFCLCKPQTLSKAQKRREGWILGKEYQKKMFSFWHCPQVTPPNVVIEDVLWKSSESLLIGRNGFRSTLQSYEFPWHAQYYNTYMVGMIHCWLPHAVHSSILHWLQGCNFSISLLLIRTFNFYTI